VRLGDVLGDGKQLRHRLERLAEVILIQSRDDHPDAAVGERAAHSGQTGIEELSFVDAHDFRVWRNQIEQLLRVVDNRRLHPHLTMRHDVVG
jgi:hypothetical protein